MASETKAEKRVPHSGLHAHRLKDNPTEAQFAEKWRTFAATNLRYLLHDGDQHYAPQASEHDETVAATIIQWLGSPVGNGFLLDNGYVRREVYAPTETSERVIEHADAFVEAFDTQPGAGWISKVRALGVWVQALRDERRATKRAAGKARGRS